MKAYRGDMGATMTPGENMNLHAQIFLQLQRNGEVTVKQYAEELAIVILENYDILTNIKLTTSQIKQERLAIQQFKNQITANQQKRANIFESRLGMKFVMVRTDNDELIQITLGQSQDTKYSLEAKVDKDTPLEIAEIKDINGISFGSDRIEDSEFRFLTFLYSSDFVFFNLRNSQSKKVEAIAKIDLKLLYDQLQVSSLQHTSGVSMNYTLQFYSDPSHLKNSEYDPQNLDRQESHGYLFEMDLKLKMIIDNETLANIADSKEQSLNKKDKDFKFRKDKYLGDSTEEITQMAWKQRKVIIGSNKVIRKRVMDLEVC
eukprot:403340354